MPQDDSEVVTLHDLGAVPWDGIHSAARLEDRQMALLPCVLVVDDEQEVTALCSAILNAAGFETLAANSGKQVIPLVRRWRVDLVITDLVMPEQEGIETILALQDCRPNLPIIAMGGVKHLSSLWAATILGARTALIKPFYADDLINLVHSVLATQPEY